MVVEVRWVNRRGDLVNQAHRAVPLPQDLVTLSAPGNLVAEYGQSVSHRASCRPIQRLAAANRVADGNAVVS